MKIGLIARADFTGLGMQTHAFYRHMRPHKTLVIDLSHLNNQRNDMERYPDAQVVRYTPYPDTRGGNKDTRDMIDRFLDDLDVVFTCETPYDYYLFIRAAEKGVKTVLQYNYEFLDHVREPDLPQPDLFMAPSLWRYDDVGFENKVFLPVPVDREDFPYTPRDRVTTFLHIGGNPALEDRNGTIATVNAWQFVKTPAKLLIRTQGRFAGVRDPRIQISSGLVHNHAELYSMGEAFIMPRKFGGLCLPLNEAMSCGMPVVMTDIPPQKEFLNPGSLIVARPTKKVMTKSLIDIYEPDLRLLANRVDHLYNDPDLVRELSLWSDARAESISWKNLAPVYEQVFGDVIEGRHPGVPFRW